MIFPGSCTRAFVPASPQNTSTSGWTVWWSSLRPSSASVGFQMETTAQPWVPSLRHSNPTRRESRLSQLGSSSHALFIYSWFCPFLLSYLHIEAENSFFVTDSNHIPPSGRQYATESSDVPVWVCEVAYRHSSGAVPTHLHLQQSEDQPTSCHRHHHRSVLRQRPAALRPHLNSGAEKHIHLYACICFVCFYLFLWLPQSFTVWFLDLVRWSYPWMNSEVWRPAMLTCISLRLMLTTRPSVMLNCIL